MNGRAAMGAIIDRRRPRPASTISRREGRSAHVSGLSGAGSPAFANDAELECAAILDFHGIPWEYEPRTFVLEEDDGGNVVEAFTPDFYLPEQDLYLEITTMKQSLVTKKNRKMRRLRELYPEIRIKLFYKRDVEALAEKYELDAAS